MFGMCCEIRAINSVEQECVRNVFHIRAIKSVEQECVRNVFHIRALKSLGFLITLLAPTREY